ncbi:MAG TPA: VWA domain-containing protein [Terriglobales bacterium]|nr:VWA domain-containing protein [Terriglobales bacterium]
MTLGYAVRVPLHSAVIAVFFLATIMPGSARAQNSLDEAHVYPRVEQVRPSDSVIENIKTKPMRVYVDLVLVPVTILDTMNRIVKGLSRDNFQVFDGKRSEQIQYFSSEDAPASVGIILDNSGSMKTKIERAREAVKEFLRTANPQDEFFLISFADRPQEISDFTQDADKLQSSLLFINPNGRTAMLDAIYLGLAKMKAAKYQRKALLIISDGGDNHSRYSQREVFSIAKESDVMMYGIGVFDRHFATQEELMGPDLLNRLTAINGGRAFTIDNPNDLPQVAHAIGLELRNQYLIGYRPQDAPRDGKWHKIKVKLNWSKHWKLPRMTVYAKTGYYAPAE